MIILFALCMVVLLMFRGSVEKTVYVPTGTYTIFSEAQLGAS